MADLIDLAHARQIMGVATEMDERQLAFCKLANLGKDLEAQAELLKAQLKQMKEILGPREGE